VPARDANEGRTGAAAPFECAAAVYDGTEADACPPPPRPARAGCDFNRGQVTDSRRSRALVMTSTRREARFPAPRTDDAITDDRHVRRPPEPDAATGDRTVPPGGPLDRPDRRLRWARHLHRPTEHAMHSRHWAVLTLLPGRYDGPGHWITTADPCDGTKPGLRGPRGGASRPPPPAPHHPAPPAASSDAVHTTNLLTHPWDYDRHIFCSFRTP